MDRIEFSKSIKSEENIEESIKLYFDETMALYNIVGDYNNLRITRTISNNIASFSLLFKSQKEARKMHELVNGSSMSIYENNFSIESILSTKNKTIKILLHK